MVDPFIFAGFHCPDFHIRWIQLVADFLLHFFVAFAVALIVRLKIRWIPLLCFSYLLDSTVLIFIFAGFNLFLLFVAFEYDLYFALRLICIFAGFHCFDFHIRWIQLLL